jgi:hypothetical protein
VSDRGKAGTFGLMSMCHLEGSECRVPTFLLSACHLCISSLIGKLESRRTSPLAKPMSERKWCQSPFQGRCPSLRVRRGEATLVSFRAGEQRDREGRKSPQLPPPWQCLPFPTVYFWSLEQGGHEYRTARSVSYDSQDRPWGPLVAGFMVALPSAQIGPAHQF